MTKKIAMVFGVVFALVGILGFVPGITNNQNLLLDTFQVDTLHNIIHLASGLVGLAVASNVRYARTYLFAFGAVYAAVAVVGLVQGDTILGLIDVNAADNILHVVLAVGLIGSGLMSEGSDIPEAPAAK